MFCERELLRRARTSPVRQSNAVAALDDTDDECVGFHSDDVDAAYRSSSQRASGSVGKSGRCASGNSTASVAKRIRQVSGVVPLYVRSDVYGKAQDSTQTYGS